MTEIEEIIYNNGERLIPDVTHNEAEKNRHFASYNFFKDKILEDMATRTCRVDILDLGCGVGYGAKILSEIPNSFVLGVDCSDIVVQYARDKYQTFNNQFIYGDLNAYIPSMKRIDYVVSRGVFEHIENAFQLINQVNFNRLFMFDVPYNEESGNPHHLLLGITEEDFTDLPNTTFFYEDIDGNITSEKPANPNMIMVVVDRRIV